MREVRSAPTSVGYQGRAKPDEAERLPGLLPLWKAVHSSTRTHCLRASSVFCSLTRQDGCLCCGPDASMCTTLAFAAPGRPTGARFPLRVQVLCLSVLFLATPALEPARLRCAGIVSSVEDVVYLPSMVCAMTLWALFVRELTFLGSLELELIRSMCLI